MTDDNAVQDDLAKKRRMLIFQRGQPLASLVDTPGLAELTAEVLRKKDRVRSALSNRLFAGKLTPEEMAKEVHYWRGFVEGMRYTVAVPLAAAGRIEDELEKEAAASGTH